MDIQHLSMLEKVIVFNMQHMFSAGATDRSVNQFRNFESFERVMSYPTLPHWNRAMKATHLIKQEVLKNE